MSDDELIGVLDDDGSHLAAATRGEMRARNLWHRATGVVVRDVRGRVYVHRRTDTKDVFPSRYDCCAGGVVGAGEDVLHAAERELAEQLGISGVPLQPDEVAWGDWFTLQELRELLADPLRPFVPDTRALLADWFIEVGAA